MVNKEAVKIIGMTDLLIIMVSLVIRLISAGWLIGMRENFILFSVFCFMIAAFEVVLARVVQASPRASLLTMLVISL
ncbi:MAG: hypothetical protein IKY23_12495 [Lachnospiraceae bacterium]|nr:hypothetical protein [Lachnospiraceae bacterium]